MSVYHALSILATNRIVCFSGSHNRELLIKALDQHEVNYDVRKLQVGDFLWIAQYESGL